MTIDEAITVLELHNAWRKGADIEMQSPTKIGMAIDMVLCELKSLRKVLGANYSITVHGFMSAWRMHTKHSATLHKTAVIRCIIFLCVGN